LEGENPFKAMGFSWINLRSVRQGKRYANPELSQLIIYSCENRNLEVKGRQK